MVCGAALFLKLDKLQSLTSARQKVVFFEPVCNSFCCRCELQYLTD